MGKGADTREAILDRAAALARSVGLDGITIGTLAAETGLSKSGLFAHFQSKEKLQLEVLERESAQFTDAVFRPAMGKPRGVPRIRVIFDRWLAWAQRPGGCLFIAASAELDDQPGSVREELVRQERQLLDSLERSAQIAVGEGHFRSGLDTAQFAFEFHSLIVGFHHLHRLLADPRAEARARKAFDALIARSQTPDS